jgi:hypothetical protein
LFAHLGERDEDNSFEYFNGTSFLDERKREPATKTLKI